MVSRPEFNRRLIADRLAAAPRRDDGRDPWLERVIGHPSAELTAWLARPRRPAAVLVGLLERPAGPTILLTERALHLPDHPGQISFPGGRLAAGEDAERAALREASEEVGLDPGRAEVLGSLPLQLTGTGFAITPVLAWLDRDFEPDPDPAEVQSVFELPLAHLQHAANRRRLTHERFGTRFRSHEILYQRHRIWGATAAILVDFLEVIDEKTNG